MRDQHLENHHQLKKMKNQLDKYQKIQMYSKIYETIHQKNLMNYLLKRRDCYKEDHECFKASREDDVEVTSLTYDQIFKLSVKFSIYNDKLDNRIIDIKDYI